MRPAEWVRLSPAIKTNRVHRVFWLVFILRFLSWCARCYREGTGRRRQRLEVVSGMGRGGLRPVGAVGRGRSRKEGKNGPFSGNGWIRPENQPETVLWRRFSAGSRRSAEEVVWAIVRWERVNIL